MKSTATFMSDLERLHPAVGGGRWAGELKARLVAVTRGWARSKLAVEFGPVVAWDISFSDVVVARSVRRQPSGVNRQNIFHRGERSRGDPGVKRFHRPYLPSDRAFQGLTRDDP
jgi:hypothetical protein